jgi:hypothetical protein
MLQEPFLFHFQCANLVTASQTANYTTNKRKYAAHNNPFFMI